jgi:hypothetical protein
MTSRSNCGACVLAGYIDPRDRAERHIGDGPNYAGWARVYVQAGRAIPRHWRRAFRAELRSENRQYAEALARDVVTYGVRGMQ